MAIDITNMLKIEKQEYENFLQKLLDNNIENIYTDEEIIEMMKSEKRLKNIIKSITHFREPVEPWDVEIIEF